MEPFDATHIAKCTKRPRAHVNALALNNLGVTFTEEVLEQLDPEDTLASEFCSLSLNAITGTDEGEALKLRALVQNKAMLILVDSGSSHSFVSSSFLQKCDISAVPMSAQLVKVANGDTIITDKQVLGLPWWLQGYTFHIDMKVLDFGAFDAILGYDWLKINSPTTCHWGAKTLSFAHQGQQIQLQGVISSTHPATEISQEAWGKCWAGNEVSALAILEVVPTDSVQQLPLAIQSLLHQYEDVFQDPQTLPPSRLQDHHIPLLPNTAPVNSRPYRYSPLQKDEIERQIAALLKAGLIVPSNSPFASPVLLVQKKDGTWCFCIDYRRLNDITVKNRYPMHILDEILDELAGTQYFIKLDMCSGYHQVRMKSEDEYKTTFKTHQGHYQFRVMPFGLTNAPATFRGLMNEVLAPFLRKFVLVFLDDILIYSPTLEEHIVHLTQVLEQLREHQLYMNMSKRSFAQTQLSYLGHIISDKGVASDSSKISAMVEWPTPTNVTELRGVLGLTGYYRK
jgi:hypothetical protein